MRSPVGIAGGKITTTIKEINEQTIPFWSSFAQSNVAKPLGYIHWFSPDLLGVELDERVPGKIAKVAKEGLFAKAGLQTDDVLLTIMGKKLSSSGDCTNLLRTASVYPRVHLKYRRGIKVIESLVSLKLD